MSSSDDVGKKCSLASVLVFLGALTAGTVCSLTSKAMLDMKSIGLSGELESFAYPLFQTATMFLGMTVGLLFHFIVLHFRIPFPGYKHNNSNNKGGYSKVSSRDEESGAIEPEMKPLPLSMYLFLAIPAMFDLIATLLCMYGLLFVTVSVYQMLRGAAIVFVAVFKQTILKDILKRYMWIGIALNVVSIVLVGLTAMLIEKQQSAGSSAANDADAAAAESGGGGALLGVFLILMGALVQSLQYVFEEKVMVSNEEDPTAAPTPPLLLIGMEGFWGLLISMLVLYPLAYYIPGPDHGCLENPYNMLVMLQNSSSLQLMFVAYFFAIFFYNSLAVLVTFMLDSIWHSILDNFRPATVWTADLLLFYLVTAGGFGEAWDQPYSWLQLLGMFILVVGTMIYNAPNPGSIKLTGGWASCFLDCSDEYEEELDVVPFDAKTQQLAPTPTGSVVVASNPAPHYNTLSPLMNTANRRMLLSPGGGGAPSAVVGSVTPVGVRTTANRQGEYVMAVNNTSSSVTESPYIRSSARPREAGATAGTMNSDDRTKLRNANEKRTRGGSMGEYGSIQ